MFRKKNNFVVVIDLDHRAFSLQPARRSQPTPDIALTVSAQVQLLETATSTPILETATPEFTTTPEFTPTPSVPTVTVSVNTNCRTGPARSMTCLAG
jgi:hypothetical protein